MFSRTVSYKDQSYYFTRKEIQFKQFHNILEKAARTIYWWSHFDQNHQQYTVKLLQFFRRTLRRSFSKKRTNSSEQPFSQHLHESVCSAVFSAIEKCREYSSNFMIYGLCHILFQETFVCKNVVFMMVPVPKILEAMDCRHLIGTFRIFVTVYPTRRFPE